MPKAFSFLRSTEKIINRCLATIGYFNRFAVLLREHSGIQRNLLPQLVDNQADVAQLARAGDL